MPKYAPLYDYLRRKSGPEVNLSFADIERILGNMLPKSACRQQWWANELSLHTRHVQSGAWLNAGYDAFLLPRERVLFRRRSARRQASL